MKERSKLHDPGKFEVLSSLNYRELDFQKYLPLLTFVKTSHNFYYRYLDMRKYVT